MAKVFVSDVRNVEWNGEPATQLLVTVLDGEVAVGDRLACGAQVVALSQTCRSCSFGQTLQEGDRGAATLVPRETALVAVGSTVTVERG